MRDRKTKQSPPPPQKKKKKKKTTWTHEKKEDNYQNFPSYFGRSRNAQNCSGLSSLLLVRLRSTSGAPRISSMTSKLFLKMASWIAESLSESYGEKQPEK